MVVWDHGKLNRAGKLSELRGACFLSSWRRLMRVCNVQSHKLISMVRHEQFGKRQEELTLYDWCNPHKGVLVLYLLLQVDCVDRKKCSVWLIGTSSTLCSFPSMVTLSNEINLAWKFYLLDFYT
ncbi:hypothetical protein LOAG_03285 [Loa loa]|uniref:Uncharacterized protein n=1 Tax=Loa loa TaxID=7209 RepID=A0A1S0U503_LOALO|nr:hypothetical protein LOAG_03285 [Loa loa]EFO25205.1 hypothetical protein LOAG_03285 [Loa loa]